METPTIITARCLFIEEFSLSEKSVLDRACLLELLIASFPVRWWHAAESRRRKKLQDSERTVKKGHHGETEPIAHNKKLP
jgi:hypothetical protein